MTTIAGIPEDELRYNSLTVFKDKNGELLFEIVHDSQIDWNKNDFRSIGMHEVFKDMKGSH